MKKSNNNNRYRNNNQIYSLNYRFDSCSIAGKFSGTALDLIKRYNELAKESHSNNDYINAEVFRQYAEHYRKIVTDINEKRNQNQVSYTQTNSFAQNDTDVSCIADDDLDSSDIDVEIGNPDIEPINPADLYDAPAEFNLNLDAPVVSSSSDNNYGSNVVEFRNEKPVEKPAVKTVEKKSFTVIEIKAENSRAEVIENVSAVAEKAKPRKYVRKKDLAV